MCHPDAKREGSPPPPGAPPGTRLRPDEIHNMYNINNNNDPSSVFWDEPTRLEDQIRCYYLLGRWEM